MTELQLVTAHIPLFLSGKEPLLPFPENDELLVCFASLYGFSALARDFSWTLSSDERARADRFLADEHRSRFITCRVILRSLLGSFLEIPPAEVCFRFGPAGKPYLANSIGGQSVGFNVSHTGNTAVFAFSSGREIGVDVERIRVIEDMDDIAARFFAPREREAFRATPGWFKQRAFFSCWTRKEAFIKATGTGLSFPLTQFEVSFGPGDEARLLSIQGCAAQARDWTIHEMRFLQDHACSVATRGRISSVIAQSIKSE